MNLKSKLFGFAAASVIALSMTTGVMAQDVHNANGNADLMPYGGGTGSCSVSFTKATMDFGEWTWNGTEYVGAPVEDSATATVIAPDAVRKCTMTVSFSGLANGNHKIGADNFSIKGTGTAASVPGMPSTWTELPENGFGVGVTAPNGDFTIDMRLDDVPDTIPAGTYTGDLKVQNVSAQ